MRGFTDLHCHPIAGVDDGVRTVEQGVALLAALHAVGFDRVVATPHIRSGLWDNRAANLAGPCADLRAALAASTEPLPRFDVSAEHAFDDVVWELFEKGEAMPFPGGRAALVEFPYESLPVKVELRLWRLKKKGIVPVIAHPERCAPLQTSDDRVDDLLGAGALLQLDVMSLVGAYGRTAQAAAERMLRRGVYHLAASDAHKPADAGVVSEAIAVLQRSAGDDALRRLLIVGPESLIA